MALVKIEATDGTSQIVDVNVPVTVSAVTTTHVDYDVLLADGTTTDQIELTVVEGSAGNTMTGAFYRQNMETIIEQGIADPYKIPVFTQTYREDRGTSGYLEANEYHAITNVTM
tara:strand:- start:469 stop:810 length:342 start_codon:yes stop_codon:yes gene_type:complete